MKSKQLLGIDLGGTNIKYGLYDDTGKPIDSGGVMKTVCDDLDVLLQNIDDIVQKYTHLDGLGVSIPGGIDKKTGIIYDGGAIDSLYDVDLKGILENKYDFPIAMENDANCATLAEKWLGNGKDSETFVCMTIGTGIGGGMVIDGKLHTGHRNYACEFGYMRIPASSADKESYNGVSTYMLLSYASDKGFSLNGEEFFAKLDENEEVLIEIYKDWINDLAMGIFNIAIIIDPERILIGGGISSQNRIYADIKTRLEELIEITIYPCEIEVMPCYFQNDAGKIGAIYQLLN